MISSRLLFLRSLTLPVLAVAMTLSGCASRIDHTTQVTSTAQQLQAKAEAISTTRFTLQTFQILSGSSKTLRIYVEGDGRAWARRSRPSMDPTPDNLLVLDLMAADPTQDKAYIARPCQFVMSNGCSISTWTDQRYSWPAVESLNEAIGILMNKGQYEQLELVGFSGGATIALLAATKRRDVSSIRTIAGNLDPAYVNRIHNVSFMRDALSPVKFTRELDDIPQLHFSGAADTIIPPKIYTAYRTWFGKQDCIAGKTIAGATHHEGWRQQWESLLALPLPTCESLPPPL